MVPKVHPPRSDFRKTWNYIGYDKLTRKAALRVGFTHVLNMDTQDPDEAVQFMIDHQAQINAEKHGGGRRGKEIKKASFHWSLSRHPGQEKLTREQWLEKVQSYLDSIGLGHHYTVIAQHTDEPQDHIHGITSLIDPVTGKLNKKAVSNIKLRSSRWAQQEEELEGEIRCHQRVENNERRANGEYVKYVDQPGPKRMPEVEERKTIITKLFFQSRDGQEFQFALKKTLGLRIAEGRRIVLVDYKGKIISLSRQIDGATAKQIREKLDGLQLPDAEKLQAALQENTDRENAQEERQAEHTGAAHAACRDSGRENKSVASAGALCPACRAAARPGTAGASESRHVPEEARSDPARQERQTGPSIRQGRQGRADARAGAAAASPGQ